MHIRWIQRHIENGSERYRSTRTEEEKEKEEEVCSGGGEFSSTEKEGFAVINWQMISSRATVINETKNKKRKLM